MAIEGASFITGNLVSWLTTPYFWLQVLIYVALFVFIVLKIRHKLRLKYQVIELVDYGKGKIGFNTFKAGWYGEKTWFKGLIWKGRLVLKSESGEQIHEFSTEDYHDINGRRGVVCFRDPTNQDYLVPISSAEVTNKKLLADIAPASYVDAAVNCFIEGARETKDFKDKIVTILSLGLGIGFALICLILIVQMIKTAQAEAADMLLQAGTQGLEGCKQLCTEIAGQICNTVAGGSP